MGIRYGKISIRDDELRVALAVEINKIILLYQKLDEVLAEYVDKLGADGMRTLALSRTHLEESSMYASKTLALFYEVK